LNEQEGLAPLLKFISKKQTKQNVQEPQNTSCGGQKSSRNKKGDKENKQDYTICSSHELIWGRYFFFARSITRPKTFLKICLYCCEVASSPLKIRLFLTDQMLQHIRIIISMKKGTLSWPLKSSNIWKGP